MKLFSPVFKILPILSVLIFIMLGCHMSLGSSPLLPSLFLVPVYYWLTFRPDWLPLWSLVLIGLFYDSLLGYALGFSSCLLLLTAVLAHFFRAHLSPENFIYTWLVFGIYSLGYTIIYVMLVSGGMGIFVSWLYVFVFYPLLAWVLIFFHTWIQVHVR